MSEVATVPNNAVAPTTPAQLMQIAVEQNADIDKLQKMMEIQIAWEANEARKAFYRSMSAFRAEAPIIAEDKDVSFSNTSYSHASLGNVLRTINPILSKHGLSVGWNLIQDSGSVTVECEISHVDGHSKKVALSAPRDDSGKKNGIQQIGSTVKYLERYTVLAALGLTTGDDDDDGRNSVPLISHEQADELVQMIHNGGLDSKKVMGYLKSKGYESIGDIPAASYEAVVQVINRSIKAKQDAESNDADS